MKEDIEQYVLDRLGGEQSSDRSDELICDCINCGKERHLYVNIKSGLAHCFRCGYAANFLRLIMDVEGCDYDTARDRSRNIALSSSEGSVSTFEQLYAKLLEVDTQDEEPLLQLPQGAVPISHRKAINGRRYLARRNIRQYAGYDIRYVAKKVEGEERYFRHLIFPEYDATGQQLVYWTTRAAYEPDSSYPKSYHPQGVKKSTLLGLRVARAHKVCILVEGPMDMLALKGFAVASLGKQLTDAQCAELVSAFEHVIVAYDGDAFEYTIAAATRLQNAGLSHVSTLRLTDGDPCDLLRTRSQHEVLLLALNRAQRFNAADFHNHL